jgi:hypothetical protein
MGRPAEIKLCEDMPVDSLASILASLAAYFFSQYNGALYKIQTLLLDPFPPSP